jgi:hypothetical protein
MPIQHQQPPADSLDALREAAEAMPDDYAQAAGMIRDVLANLDDRWPHPVYVASLRVMASASGLGKARMIGWRFLTRAGGLAFAFEIQNDADGTNYRLSELDQGPLVEAMLSVLEDEDLARQIGPVVLRPALLRLNALGVTAVWLRGEEEKQDIVIPIPPASGSLDAGRLYTVEQFQDALRGEAKEELAHDTLDA